MSIYSSFSSLCLFFLSFGVLETIALQGNSVNFPTRRMPREWNFNANSTGALYKRADGDGGFPTLCNSKTSWQNKSSDASPTAADCQDLVTDFMKTSPRVYIFGCHEIKELRQKGTCAFNVQLQDKSDPAKDEYACGDESSDYATIAVGDITSFIQGSIDKYKIPNGKVGSEGVVECMVFPRLTTTGPRFVNVTWGLYSS